MKIVALYHPNSEFSRVIEEYAHDFHRQRNKEIELLSLDTRDGTAMASLYDIVQYPALLAIRDDGQLMKNWEGAPLPLMNEVAGYAEQ